MDLIDRKKLTELINSRIKILDAIKSNLVGCNVVFGSSLEGDERKILELSGAIRELREVKKKVKKIKPTRQ